MLNDAAHVPEQSVYNSLSRPEDTSEQQPKSDSLKWWKHGEAALLVIRIDQIAFILGQ